MLDGSIILMMKDLNMSLSLPRKYVSILAIKNEEHRRKGKKIEEFSSWLKDKLQEHQRRSISHHGLEVSTL